MGAISKRFGRRSSCLIVAAAAVFSANDFVRATTVSWAVDSDGQWTVPGNWSTDALPGSSDDVVISRTAAAFNITLSSNTQTINSFLSNNNLTVDGVALGIAGASQANGALSLINGGGIISEGNELTINGPFLFGGALAGTGHTTLSSSSVTTIPLGGSPSISHAVDNFGTVATNTSANLFFVNGILNNSGLFEISNFGQMGNGGGTNAFNNLAGGVVDKAGTSTFSILVPFNNAGVANIFAGELAASSGTNTGTINVSPGASFTPQSAYINSGTINFNGGGTYFVPLNNAGTVHINAGVFTPSGGGTNTGTIAVASGATLNLQSNYTAAAGSIISGGGGVSFSGFIPSFAGTVSVTGPITFNSQVTFTGNQTFNGAVNLVGGGAISGPADVTIAGPLSWAGAMSGSGKTTLASTSVTTLGITPSLSRAVDNAGFFSTGFNSLTLQSTSFRNLAGGTYVSQGALSLFNSAFTNAGTFMQSGGGSNFNSQGGTNVFTNTGTFLLGNFFTSNVPFNNSGVVQANSATNVTFAGGGSNTGSILFASTATASTAPSFVNSGTISFLNGGAITNTVNGPGSINVLGGNLNASLVTLASGTINVWPGANLSFGFSDVVNAPVTIAGGGGVSFNGTISSFAGTISTTGPVYVNSAVTFSGAQTFNGALLLAGSGLIGGSADINIAGPFYFGGPMTGSGRTILLPGSNTLVSATGNATLERTMNNSGTVNYASINSFILSSGTFNNSGIFNAEGNGALSTGITPDAFNNLAGGTFNAAPPGTFTSAVTFNNSGVVNVLSGELKIVNGGANTAVMNVFPGATLTLSSLFTNSGTVNLYSGSTYSGSIATPGVAAIQSGSASLIGISTYSGTLSVAAGASAVFAGTFNAQPSFNIKGSGSVVFNGTAPNTFAGTFSNSGQVTVNGNLNLVGLPTLAKPLNVNGSLEVSAPGPSLLPTIRAMLVSGFNGGVWDGAGINSSAAHGDGSHLTGLGYATAGELGYSSFGGTPVASSAIIVKYTYYGDSSLDGQVDLGNDFNLFVQGLLKGGSSWEFGDFNYDGVVNTADFQLFIDGYETQGGSLGALDDVIGNSALLTTAQKSQLASLVPEPMSAVMLMVLAAGAVVRRRRH